MYGIIFLWHRASVFQVDVIFQGNLEVSLSDIPCVFPICVDKDTNILGVRKRSQNIYTSLLYAGNRVCPLVRLFINNGRRKIWLLGKILSNIGWLSMLHTCWDVDWCDRFTAVCCWSSIFYKDSNMYICIYIYIYPY